MAKLAQTSIQFRQLEVSEERLDRLGGQIDRVAAQLAGDIYGESVYVDVVIEAGLLLIRITIIGGLMFGAYDGLSKYKNFRESVVLLAEDARHFGSAIYDKVLALTDQDRADRVAIREMTPGKIAGTIHRLEALQRIERTAPRHIVEEELLKIARDLEAIERDLGPAEREAVRKELELEGLLPDHKLPIPVPDQADMPKAVINEREDESGPALAKRPRGRRTRLRYHNHFAVKQLDQSPH